MTTMMKKAASTVVLLAGAALWQGCNGSSGSDAGDVVSTADGPGDTATAQDASDASPGDVPDGAVGTDVITDVGGDGGPDGSPGDAGDGGTMPTCTLAHVVVTTSDYTMFGGFQVADLATRTFVAMPTGTDGGVDQDHAVRTSGCIPFGLGHSSPSTVAVLDPAHLVTPVRSIALPDIGTGTAALAANPVDVAVVSAHKAYVTQYNGTRVAIVDPTAATVTGGVDLSAFADSDGIPEMSTLALVGTKLFVALQLLDRTHSYAVPAHSAIVVIDTITDTVIDTNPSTASIDPISLSFGNPQSAMVLTMDGHTLLVAEPGSTFSPTLDGGLDMIDVGTYAIVRTLSHTTLLGDPTSVAVVTGTTAWMTVDLAAASHQIVSFDTASGTVAPARITTPATYTYANLRTAPDGTVWAIGADYNAGTVHAFTPSGTALFTTPVALGALNATSLDFIP